MSDLAEENIPEKNLFMICKQVDHRAFRELPVGYDVRSCREDELDVWLAMPFDNPVEAQAHRKYMLNFFERVYANQKELFYQKCLFVCDHHNMPVATAFIWKIHGKFNTLHWVKVLKAYENQGLGRALLSIIMKELKEEDYPVYLHTQPQSFRAIKLYTDFGFKLLSDPIIGPRENHLQESMPILKEDMKPVDFDRLEVVRAPENFILTLASIEANHF